MNIYNCKYWIFTINNINYLILEYHVSMPCILYHKIYSNKPKIYCQDPTISLNNKFFIIIIIDVFINISIRLPGDDSSVDYH